MECLCLSKACLWKQADVHVWGQLGEGLLHTVVHSTHLVATPRCVYLRQFYCAKKVEEHYRVRLCRAHGSTQHACVWHLRRLRRNDCERLCRNCRMTTKWTDVICVSSHVLRFALGSQLTDKSLLYAVSCGINACVRQGIKDGPHLLMKAMSSRRRCNSVGYSLQKRIDLTQNGDGRHRSQRCLTERDRAAGIKSSAGS